MNLASFRRSQAFFCLLAAAWGPMLVSGVARAQAPEPTPPMTPQTGTPPAPTGQQQAFVLVAMTGDVQVDPFLRSTAQDLENRLKARGFAPVPPPRLRQALEADPNGISTLRSRLGASIMIRVDSQSRTVDGISLLVTVQSEVGERQVTVSGTPSEIPTKVVAAVEPLLPPPTSPPQRAAGGALDRVVLKDGTTVEGQVQRVADGVVVIARSVDGAQMSIPLDRVSQIIPRGATPRPGSSWSWATESPPTTTPSDSDWSKRGGSILTFDVQAQIIGVLKRMDHPYIILYPDGQTMRFTGDSASGGGGGGMGFHIGLLHLAIPDPSQGGSTLWGFHLGSGVDLGAVGFGYRTEATTTMEDPPPGEMGPPAEQVGGETKWAAGMVVMLPVAIGGQVGIGRFASDGEWRGVMVGLDWRPTYAYTKPSNIDGFGSFNYLGFQAHLDFASLKASSDSAEANFRMTLAYLPVIERNASYISLGLGAVWY